MSQEKAEKLKGNLSLLRMLTRLAEAIPEDHIDQKDLILLEEAMDNLNKILNRHGFISGKK